MEGQTPKKPSVKGTLPVCSLSGEGGKTKKIPSSLLLFGRCQECGPGC